jgi:hypothetical protein
MIGEKMNLLITDEIKENDKEAIYQGLLEYNLCILRHFLLSGS